MLAMVDAVPMVMQWPFERCMHDSAAVNSSCAMLPAAHVFGHLPDARARADLLAAEVARQHRAAGNADGRKVAARRAHQQRGRGLVAAHEQHDAVERIAADATLRRPCWRDCGTTSRWDAAASSPSDITGNSSGNPPGFVDAALHELRELAEVPVAGRQLAPGVADADDRAGHRTGRRDSPGS